MVNPTLRLLARYVSLPRGVTKFECEHLLRMTRLSRRFFWCNVPGLGVVALLAGTSVLAAVALAAMVAVGPSLARVALRHDLRAQAWVHGVAAMLLAGVMVYVGRGPLQIEMHFCFFVLITLLVIFANPTVIVVAAVTAALHHLVLWLWLPYAVFNHDAAVWTVVVHAAFVVAASSVACFVSRKFFDNVIGLERVVARRTQALYERNHDMAMILDNVSQGLVTVSLDGNLGGEQSRAMTRWFGTRSAVEPFWSYVAGHDPDLATWIELCFKSLHDGLLPTEAALAQLPTRIDRDGWSLRVEYRPIGAPIAALLVVISDITAELESVRADREQRDLIAMVERAYRDQASFLESVKELDELVEACISLRGDERGALDELRRHLHTLKGNAALARVLSLAERCHELESQIDEQQAFPPAVALEALGMHWASLRDRLDHLLGLSRGKTLMVDWAEYQAVLAQIVPPEPPWALPIRRWGQVPTKSYLSRFAEQAQQLAARLGKGELDVEVLDHGVYLEAGELSAVWAALVHAIRNSVDHGLESPEQRAAAGKPDRGRLQLCTEMVGAELWVSVVDDGKGIDWEAVAARARERGLPADTQHDLEAAIFAPGVSTAACLSTISGRGVGMTALQAAVAEAQGTIEILSTPGRGTTVRCRVPLPAAQRVLRRSTRVPVLHAAPLA